MLTVFIILVMNQAAFLPSQQIDLELEDIYQPASTQPPASRRFPVYLKTQHTPVSRFVSTNLPAAPTPPPPRPNLSSPRVAEAGQSYWLCLNWGNEIKISNSHFHVEVEIFTNWNNFQLAVILKLKIFIFVPRCGSICMGASVGAAGPAPRGYKSQYCGWSVAGGPVMDTHIIWLIR